MAKNKQIEQRLANLVAVNRRNGRKPLSGVDDSDREDSGGGATTGFKSQMAADILRGLGANSPYVDPRIVDEVKTAVNNGHQAWEALLTKLSLQEQNATTRLGSKTQSKAAAIVVGDDLSEPLSAAYFISATKPAAVAVDVASNADVAFDVDLDHGSTGQKKR